VVTCDNCHQRKATDKWVGEGGVLELVHGLAQDWCEFCVVTRQLEYARRYAARVPILEQRLGELEAPDVPGLFSS
jgi:ABC-type polar amino acid transport system ATPase subunit